eukprot:TRINITY_DN4337_c0_g1_i1.p1 TRINITY_DN4337_c0_g1~~TRINITY_DN4337_c0_g1_i1.p1  ORF type:complete len:560 (+),score=227.27 TRINITY_DN4337_c0_g1_i1:115-1794(+)
MQGSRYDQSLDILKAGASEQKGEECRLSNFMGAIALSDLVKTTLGPKGMDKILMGGAGKPGRTTCNVTNDGATILKSIHVDNPAAKILIDISKTQDDEVGDGTTTVCVLAGELLRQAERLILVEQIHPQVIVDGWRAALVVARKALQESSVTHESDQEAFKKDLLNIARTTLSSKVLSFQKDHFAQLAVEAVMRIGNADSAQETDPSKTARNLELISIMKKLGGTLEESTLEDGFLLDKKIGIGQPHTLKDCKVLVANTPMDTDKIKIFGARVKVDSVDAVSSIERAEKDKMKSKVDKILAFGCNVFINRQLIYNYPEELFAEKGVMAIEHADFDGVERLAFALGGEVVSQFDEPDASRLGGCDKIDQVMIGEDTVIRFSGLKGGRACTIVLRGSSQQVLDEADRSLRDALCIVQSTTRDPRVVFGAGCSEALMAGAVWRAAHQERDVEEQTTSDARAFGKAKAMEAFAAALTQIPLIISESAGMGAQCAHDLAALHRQKPGSRQGIDINTGKFLDAEEAGVTESFHSKSSALEYAVEAAEMILRVDNIIRCAPRERRR